MTAEELLAIAADWGAAQPLVTPLVERRVRLPEGLVPGVALVIQGVRRCGKSTLLRQCVTRYGLDETACCFLNLEDPRLANALSWETLETLVEAFLALHGPDTTCAFFLDEIQNVQGWERWLRGRLDRGGPEQYLLTGSNATLLSGELGSTLTGRHLTVELYPLSLTERRQVAPALSVETFLAEGGFPAPVLQGTGDLQLRQYLRDIVERDVRERVGARSSQPVLQVVQMAMETAGSELSLRRLAAAAGIAVETAQAYLEACEAAYLLFSVPYFTWSAQQRARRNRKVYPVDTGLRRVTALPGSADRGKALECATFVALRQRFQDISYWRGAGEVDFVIREGQRITPVQVTWDEPQPRHEEALLHFHQHFPQAEEAVFVTAESFPELDHGTLLR